MEMIVIEKSELFREFERFMRLAVKTKNESDWMTKKETAEYLKVSPSTIDNWRRFHGFPTYLTVGEHHPRFHKAEVDEWMKVNRGLAKNGK